MSTRRGQSALGGLAVAALGVFALVLAARPVQAQVSQQIVEVTRVAGVVEVARRGQPPWQPATVGTRLGVDDDIRALSGASAELRMSDGSTLMLAENSRFIVTRSQSEDGTQTTILHLAVGKVRALIGRAAVTLVRIRQTNFAISTPVAVAAVRGTELVVQHDPGPSDISKSTVYMGLLQGEALCISLGSGTAGVVPSGKVFLQQGGTGGCIQSSLSPSALAGPQNLGTLNHPLLFSLVTVIAPDVVERILNSSDHNGNQTSSLLFNPSNSSRPQGGSLSEFQPH